MGRVPTGSRCRCARRTEHSGPVLRHIRARHLLVAAALATASYGAAHTAEPANYVLWALIFLSLLVD